MKSSIRRAVKTDAEQLIRVFDLSFYADYIRYGECPGYNKSMEQMLNSIEHNMVYQILADDRVAGAISVQPGEGSTYFLGALCVIPEYANRGIGQQAMRFLDEEFPQVEKWALETPADKLQNHYFYRKFGYESVREYLDGSVRVCRFERVVCRDHKIHT